MKWHLAGGGYDEDSYFCECPNGRHAARYNLYLGGAVDYFNRLELFAELAQRAIELVRFATDIPSREDEANIWLRDYEAINSNVNVST